MRKDEKYTTECTKKEEGKGKKAQDFILVLYEKLWHFHSERNAINHTKLAFHNIRFIRINLSNQIMVFLVGHIKHLHCIW